MVTDFLIAGMSQTQGVQPLKMRPKYLVDDPSHRLAWASWSRMSVSSHIFIFVVFAKIRPLIQYHRTSPYDAILGGAEDVMGDLGVRQALRRMPKNARL